MPERFRLVCPVCDANNVSERLHLKEYKVLRCANCSVEFLAPQPTQDVLAGIYSATYFLNEGDGITDGEVHRLKRETAKLYVDQILSMQGDKRGQLLEIGCGTGDFLIEAQSRGFHVNGIETSEHATATANRRLAANVVQHGYIDTVRLKEDYFEVVVFSDVIEHVADPKAFLAAVHRCLRPGGLVFIVTPSTDSWSRRLMGTRWMEYKLEHLFYFNPKSLNYLLTRCTFDSIAFRNNVKVLSFEYVRAHFRRFQVPIWTSVVELAARIIPGRIANKSIRMVASGVIASAHRRVAPQTTKHSGVIVHPSV